LNNKHCKQADSSDAYDPDDEASDNELMSELAPVPMKAVRQLSKNIETIQGNANRPRRRRARVVPELQKEKDSDLSDDGTEVLVSLIIIYY
jgi:hypothetical protein